MEKWQGRGYQPGERDWHDEVGSGEIQRPTKRARHENAADHRRAAAICPPKAREGITVALLSLFGGVGTSALALRATGASIVRHLALEVDPRCIEIPKKNHLDS